MKRIFANARCFNGYEAVFEALPINISLLIDIAVKVRPGSRFNPGPSQNPKFWPGSNRDLFPIFFFFTYSLLLLQCWENVRANE